LRCATYGLHAQRLGAQPVYEPPQTTEEREAWNLIVECSGQATFSGGAAAAGDAGGAPPAPPCRSTLTPS
jgi:hypothetical protein